MIVTATLFVLFTVFNAMNARTFHGRQSDSLTTLRETCAKTPSANECISIKSQMEDLLRKCAAMTTPVSACSDVKNKYCFLWSRELYCSIGGGGSGGSILTPTTKAPPSNNDPDWYQIPTDTNELKMRGDYCVAHQAEQKCRNLLSSLKTRYDDCAKRPKTDYVCQSFKSSLCAAFPKFSPCLNVGGDFKKRKSLLERILRRLNYVSEKND